jgi:hypothetical protein
MKEQSNSLLLVLHHAAYSGHLYWRFGKTCRPHFQVSRNPVTQASRFTSHTCSSFSVSFHTIIINLHIFFSLSYFFLLVASWWLSYYCRYFLPLRKSPIFRKNWHNGRIGKKIPGNLAFRTKLCGASTKSSLKPIKHNVRGKKPGRTEFLIPPPSSGFGSPSPLFFGLINGGSRLRSIYPTKRRNIAEDFDLEP